MFYFEIKNKDTNEAYMTINQSFSKACKAKGWKPYRCVCIWRASVDNACDPANY